MFNYCPPKEIQDLQSETFPDGNRYYTLPDGSRLPSVTTVIGAQKKHIFQAWRNKVGDDVANAITRKATSRGTNVHTLCERYLNNESLGDIMPDAHEMFLSIKPHLNRINNIHYQEQALWSKQLKMAGRVDCIAEFDGDLVMFPSSFEHEVPKTTSKETRISIAFNTFIRGYIGSQEGATALYLH